MKTIQRLTVMMIMTVVYTASIPTKVRIELLKDIHDAALKMSTNETSEEYVAKIGQEGGPTCVDKFFCLAEKALEKANTKNRLHASRLIRLLKQFNNETTNCTLTGNAEHTLKKFLEDIVNCTDHWRINHKP